MHRLVPALLLLLVSASGVAAAQDPSAQLPEALRKQLAKELKQRPAVAFRTPAGVSGKVEAAAAPRAEAVEGGEQLTIPLGTALPVSCTIVPERVDAGAQIWRVAEQVRSNLTLVGMRTVEITAVAGSPLVVSEILYAVDSPAGKQLGQLELAVYAHDAHSLFCQHDEPGYSATFRRVVKGLAGSIRSKGEDERASARFAEILVMRAGQLPIGYVERVFWDRQGGGTVMASYTAQLMPRSQSELVTVDSYSSEATDGDEMLVSGTYVHMQNGEIDGKGQVDRGEGNAYAYQGEKSGKKLSGTFETRAGLAGELWFARRFAKKQGYGPKEEVRHQGYSFEASPGAPIEISYRKDAARPRRAAATVGDLQLSGELDAHGLFATSEMPLGPVTLVLERAWSRGAP